MLLDRVMNFWKSHFMGNYSARKIFKRPYLKITKGTFIWTFYMVGTWYLICSFPVCHLTNLVEGFWKFWFLAILWLENCPKIQYGRHFWQFSSNKMAKNQYNIQNTSTKFMRWRAGHSFIPPEKRGVDDFEFEQVGGGWPKIKDSGGPELKGGLEKFRVGGLNPYLAGKVIQIQWQIPKSKFFCLLHENSVPQSFC